MTRARVAAFSALGLALACGVITIQPVPFAPSNTCSADNDCEKSFPDASTSCTGSACISNGSFRPIVVVSVPSTANAVGGSTFALAETYLLHQSLAPAGCGSIQEGFTCVFTPPLASVQNGYINVSAGFGRGLWPPNGLRPNMPDNSPTTLPTRTIFHPLWIDPVTGVPLLAAKLGLPLPDVVATEMPTIFLLGPTNGTSAVPGFTYSANVPQPIDPTDPSAFYGIEMIPKLPFDIFPPFIRPLAPRRKLPPTADGGVPSPPDPGFLDGFGVQPPTATLSSITLSLPAISTSSGLQNGIPAYDPATQVLVVHTFEVDEEPGAASVEGWSMFIVDDENRRVSSRVPLPAGATKSVTIYEATTSLGDQTGETLVIAPPPTLDSPRLTSPASPSIIAGPFKFFPLPNPVLVSGTVVRADSLTTQASAKVIFFAGTPSGVGPTLIHADGSPAIELDYQKAVATDSIGAFNSVSLPPGTLRTYIVPDDPNLALTVFDNFKVPDTNGQSQLGKTIEVNPRTHVKGRVVLADGTPLYAAQVVISASADLPFVTNDDPLAHPRESSGFTDVNGNFDVPSDPGFVDVSIRPQDGTRYPWVVLTHRAVTAFGGADGGTSVPLTLPQITIPLPTAFPPTTGVLTDFRGNPLPFAVARAYAFPPPVTTPDGGTTTSRGARLIGQTVTDAAGNFQLFVAPPDTE